MSEPTEKRGLIRDDNDFNDSQDSKDYTPVYDKEGNELFPDGNGNFLPITKLNKKDKQDELTPAQKSKIGELYIKIASALPVEGKDYSIEFTFPDDRNVSVKLHGITPLGVEFVKSVNALFEVEKFLHERMREADSKVSSMTKEAPERTLPSHMLHPSKNNSFTTSIPLSVTNTTTNKPANHENTSSLPTGLLDSLRKNVSSTNESGSRSFRIPTDRVPQSLLDMLKREGILSFNIPNK